MPDYGFAEQDIRLLTTLQQESDRGCVLFGAEILNENLESLLRVFLRDDSWSRRSVVDPLFRAYAPLSTFSSRIAMVYSLRLIEKVTFSRLELVRKLRNTFAHESGPIGFDHPMCADRLNRLTRWGKEESADLTEDSTKLRQFGRQILTEIQIRNRLAFVLAVVRLAGHIDGARRAVLDQGQLGPTVSPGSAISPTPFEAAGRILRLGCPHCLP